MKQEIEQAVQDAVKAVFDADTDIVLSRPDEKFGDYATNVALQLSKQLGRPPREIAEGLAAKLRESLKDEVSEVTVAGPGFLNIKLSDSVFAAELGKMLDPADPYGPAKRYRGQVIVTEYSDPNPFKVLHAGHLYTSVVGYAISNLYELAGAEVHRVNFGGDVGMHVGKTLWAILRELGGEHPEKLADVDQSRRSEWMASCYVTGNNLYDEDEAAKAEMVALNKRVYQIHNDKDHESPLARIYWTCRQWSYEYFDDFYDRIGTPFEKYYPESETAQLGLDTVRAHTPGVFEESDGAIVFKGEDHGLHTRVFVTSQGLPAYEAKDVGLILKKKQDYDFDQSIIVTANEQLQYMEVVLKAIEQFEPELYKATRHLTHGLVKLAGGVKMSSRRGNILRAVDVLDVAAAANREATGKDDDVVVLGAVKYAFLKQRIGGDIIYDPIESVSLQGNSGPYLQYAHARAHSILRKATMEPSWVDGYVLNDWERLLVRKLTEYPEVVDTALDDLMPHHVCSYLYELSQTFNRFYENNRVIGDEHEAGRLTLLTAYIGILQHGLGLLGIDAPEQM
ncbi:MAG TPA: arginine--tRNA ligase [Candidatus Saccharimonadales bacterium]|jgi:arginyl-tRNA synthetase